MVMSTISLEDWSKIKTGQIVYFGKHGVPRRVEKITERSIAFEPLNGLHSITFYARNDRGVFKLWPSHTLHCNNGWLSPEGELYPCLFAGHTRLGQTLEKMHGAKFFDHRYMEKLGWIKLSTSLAGWYQWIPEDATPTQAQIDTIYEWCKVNKAKLPTFLKD
jgi:hypothetical protein